MLARFPVILVVTLAACDRPGGDPTVTLDANPAPATGSAPSAGVEVGPEGVRVSGVMALPDRCQGLTADVSRDERTVRLWIMRDPVQETCPPGATNVAYTAEIDGLEPGRYNLQVVHGRPGKWRGTEPVLVHPIVIP